MPQEHYQRVHGFSTIPVIHPALFFDDCSGTFAWQVAATGDDWTAEYDPIAAHVQVNGILLKTRQTNPTIMDHVTIYRRLWLPPLGILRLQAMFSLIDTAPDAGPQFILTWNDGELAHDAGVSIYGFTGAVSYASGYDAGDITWTPIADWKACIIEHAWNKVDLSINLDTGFYHRIQLNEHVLDASHIPIHTHLPALEKHMHLLIKFATVEDAQHSAYFDQILLTQESP